MHQSPAASFKLPLLLSALCLSAEADVISVSPAGHPSASCSPLDPCSLIRGRERARERLRTASEDVVVELAGGTYELESAFQLDARDAGRPGVHMVYRAARGQAPILSGGRRIAGWTLSDAQKGIWTARVPAGLRTRQLYVNGVRAIRSRGPTDPAGYAKTRTGFRRIAGVPDFPDGTEGLEVVSRAAWKEYRCPAEPVRSGAIDIKRPCWDASQAHAGFAMEAVSWFENAYLLLDEEGEWYLDTARERLYYKPRPGESMPTARVIAPVLESLLIAKGTADKPLANLRISGLTFAYATWMQPSTDLGFPDLQSTYQYGDDGNGGDKIPSSVAFWFADSLVLERNTFTALGGNGPALEAGCRNGRISGNRIDDISGNGLHVGNITAYPDDPRERVAGNAIENNRVTRIGQEYHGASAIFAGYVSETRILHNEISDVPYTGISLGWGWGRPSYMRGNEVAFNLVHHHLHTMTDGGGIYTLGAQPDTRVHHNFVHDQPTEYGGLYPDQGSSHMRWDSNVVKGAGRWFFMSNGGMRGNVIVDNFSDTRAAVLIGEDCRIEGNEAILDGRWPETALGIMAGAGLQEAFRDGPAPDAFPDRLPFPGSDGPDQTTSIRRGVSAKPGAKPLGAERQWVAPGRFRNILGRALGR